jgi:hypothetical protein
MDGYVFPCYKQNEMVLLFSTATTTGVERVEGVTATMAAAEEERLGLLRREEVNRIAAAVAAAVVKNRMVAAVAEKTWYEEEMEKGLGVAWDPLVHEPE